MKKIISVSILTLGLFFVAGCTFQTTTPINPGTGQQVITQPAKTLSYLISTEPATKYCDGANMDSSGYQKTITKEVVTNIDVSNMTPAELAKAIVVAATTGQCQMALQQNNITVEGDTVSIAPIDGWAGISIAICSCKPQIKVNLLRMPGIKKVMYN